MLTIRMKDRIVKPFKTYSKGKTYVLPEWIALELLNEGKAEVVEKSSMYMDFEPHEVVETEPEEEE